MFSSRLRQTRTWASAVSLLASTSTLNLQGKLAPLQFRLMTREEAALIERRRTNKNENATESSLDCHDVSIPIPSNSPPAEMNHRNDLVHRTYGRRLRVAFLEPHDLGPENRSALLDNLHRLSNMTGGSDIAVVLLLEKKPKSAVGAQESSGQGDKQGISPDAIVAYLQLQSLIASDVELRTIPILPLHDLSALFQLLQDHVRGLSIGITNAMAAQVQTTQASPLDVLAHCTSAAPTEVLDQHTVYLLTDLVSSIRDLTSASLSEARRARIEEELRDEVSESVVESLWQFWQDEWAVE